MERVIMFLIYAIGFGLSLSSVLVGALGFAQALNGSIPLHEKILAFGCGTIFSPAGVLGVLLIVESIVNEHKKSRIKK